MLCYLLVYCRCVEVGSESVSTDNFLVLTCLGWLFEVLVLSPSALCCYKCFCIHLQIPNISNSAFFEFLKEDTIPDTTLALPSHAKPQVHG